MTWISFYWFLSLIGVHTQRKNAEIIPIYSLKAIKHLFSSSELTTAGGFFTVSVIKKILCHQNFSNVEKNSNLEGSWKVSCCNPKFICRVWVAIDSWGQDFEGFVITEC